MSRRMFAPRTPVSEAEGRVAVATVTTPAESCARGRILNRTRLDAVVAIAFAARLATVIIRHTYRMSPVDPITAIPHFKFGFESGMVAGSLASGMGFASPFGGDTGLTAWLAPAYPYLTAGVFKLFGLYTNSSAFVLLTLNSLFSALTCIPVYWIARRFSGERVAKWTAWLWALLPMAMYWSIRWLWETSLSALLLTTALWLTFKLENHGSLRWWAAWGAVWGLLALTNPACCSILPFAGIWLCWRRLRMGRKWLWPVAVSALVSLAMVTPWEVRNYQAFHQFIPIRDNAGAELRMANGPGSVGLWMAWEHPSQNPRQLSEFKRLGETGYIAKEDAEAKAFILASPVRFLRLCVTRMVYFWAGVPRPSASAIKSALHNWFFMLVSILAFGGLLQILWRRTPGGVVLLAATTIYPVAYYLTFVDPRYRHPIEPVLVFLATCLVFQARELRSQDDRNYMEIPEGDVDPVVA